MEDAQQSLMLLVPPPPPPPEIPPHVIPIQVEPELGKSPMFSNRNLRAERALVTTSRPGSAGKKVSLLTNYFKVKVANAPSHFNQYHVSIYYENGDQPVGGKTLRWKVINQLHKTYKSELAGGAYAYDGVHSLFRAEVADPLPNKKQEFTVLLEVPATRRINAEDNPSASDQKRQKVITLHKTFKVQITFACKVSIKAITDAVSGQGSEHYEGIQVLNTILRQHAQNQGCLIIRQSFFRNEPQNFGDLSGGVLCCRGFNSNFRVIQGGLFLNFDVSNTVVIQPGPVIDFLLANQNVKDPSKIDWKKAMAVLRNLKIKVHHLNAEFRVTGVSERCCKDQKFPLKLSGTNPNNNHRHVEVTVHDYFASVRGMALRNSANFPCIIVGKPHSPTFFPIELCSLVSLQSYRKELTHHQRVEKVKKSSRRPEELFKDLTDGLQTSNYDADPMLRSCNISVSKSLTHVEGRILPAPRLRVAKAEVFLPRNGYWTFKDKMFIEKKMIERWAVVNFSNQSDIRCLCVELAKLCVTKEIFMDRPAYIFEESPNFRRKPASVRVEKMFDQIKLKFCKTDLNFLLCILPTPKKCDIYGPWKRKCLGDFGIPNQCVAKCSVDELYLMNVLVKINAKLGGMNFHLAAEISRTLPYISKVPTIILGMDISRPSPDQLDVPAIATVVGSRNWPLVSCYSASFQAQPPQSNSIDSLFKPVSEHEDQGMIRELLLEFYATSGQKKPAQIIIFRKGVSEDYDQLLRNELEQAACNFLDENWFPKFTVIVSRRGHHTKFMKANSFENVPPGTIVDRKVCNLEFNNFYICPHTTRVGTTRPTHYIVLVDEIGFSSDELQELVHCLSYVSQRSTKAISEVAPLRYARLAGEQMSQMVKSGPPPRGLGRGGVSIWSGLPKLHKDVCNSMFFC